MNVDDADQDEMVLERFWRSIRVLPMPSTAVWPVPEPVATIAAAVVIALVWSIHSLGWLRVCAKSLAIVVTVVVRKSALKP
jgi:hypothetical protein